MLKDASGKLVAEAAAPHMWDSSRDPVSGEPEHQAEVATSIETAQDGSTTLVLTPDPAFFTQDVTYPVTVDPSSTLAVTTDTWVQTPDYPDSQQASQELKAGTYDSGTHIARSYVKFDVAKFTGKHILSATMSLYSYYSSTCATSGPGTEARRVTSPLDTSTVTWGAQPSTTTNMFTNTGHWGYDASCPENWSNWTLTGMVQDWANGSPNYGIQVRSANESDPTTWRRFRSANYTTSGYAPKLVVNYNSHPSQATLISPVTGSATSDTTPTFQAKATDADGDKLTYHFEIWNSTASTMIANGDSGQVSSGSTGSWTSPALAQGTYKWRALARDGTDGSTTWPAWNTLTVDTTAPATTTVSSGAFPANAWSGTPDGNGDFSGSFTFTPPGTDVSSVVWNLDGGTVHTHATTGAAVSDTISFRAGKHTLGVRTKDAAGNTSALTNYVFYAGSGAALLTPAMGDTPARRVPLTGQGKSTETGVTYQYRIGETGTWANIPAANVRLSNGSTLSAWPFTAPGGLPAALTWNITDTLSEDGPVDVRAVFTDGATSDYSPANTITVDRNAGSAPSVTAGPASVNALTGDATLSATDASAFDMSVSRTASSRRPSNGSAQEGQVAIFGPQWTAGTTAEITDSDWSFIRQTSTSSVALVDVDGDPTGFTATSGGGWKPEPGAEDLTLTGSVSTTFTLKDTDGTTTTFTKVDPAATTWQVSTTYLPTSNSTTTVVSQKIVDGGGITRARPQYVIAPTSAVTAATCQTTPATKGCRMLEYVYATTTTATGGTFGDFAGQVKQIKLWATTPGDSASTASVIAQYTYDTAGQLREEWDPRVSPALKTTYAYDTAGRVATQTDPGELPWTFTYGNVGSSSVAGDGMLLSASRPTLQQGSNTQTDGGTAATNIVYNVPVSGSSAPYPMAATDVAGWGQADAPTDATAVFPADQVPSSHDGTALTSGSYSRATISYIDASGRQVNTATPGWHFTTTEYDRYGNTIRELTALNRELALGTQIWQQDELATLGILGKTAAERAQALSSTSVYSADGQRELEEFGPLHEVTLASTLTAGTGGTDLPAGTVVPAREHTVNTYDEGRPTDGSATVSNEVTTTSVGAFVDGYPGDGDVRTTTTAYDWVKGLPTQTATDPSGLNLVKTTTYDSQGRVTKTTLPKSNGTDAGATVTTYWSATGTGTCNGKPEWADLVCSVGPAGAITGGGTNPSQLPTSTSEYDRWGLVTKVTDVANGYTRTTNTTHDGAGRVTATSVTGGLGTAVPDTTITYDAATGDKATTSAGGQTISYTYDVLGRQTQYTDGAGATTTTAYDALDRPVTVTNSVPSTTTYTYDTTQDPRGLLTSLTDSVAGTFSAQYNSDGQMWSQHLPGGVHVDIAIDETGSPTGRYYKRDSDGADITWDAGSDTIQGQQATHTTTNGPTANQTYTYDKAGRLTQADDTQADVTTHRTYTFDNNTNRTGLTTATDNPDGTPGTPTSTTYTYDSADRLQTVNGTNVVYGNFGNTLTQATGALNSYYTNNLVRQQATPGNTSRQTWTLDAAQRLASWTTETNNAGTWTQTGAKTNHYGADGDSPDWTVEDATGTITRNVQGISGDLDATTTATGGTVLQLTNLHGDVTVQYPLDTAIAPTVLAADEYGNPINATPATRYGWLGAKQRSSETPTAATLMGVRLYDPTLGRFLQTDPIPGGNANAYEYVNADPGNQFDLDGKICWNPWNGACRNSNNTVSFLYSAGSICASWCPYIGVAGKTFRAYKNGKRAWHYGRMAKRVYRRVGWSGLYRHSRGWLGRQGCFSSGAWKCAGLGVASFTGITESWGHAKNMWKLGRGKWRRIWG